MADPFHRYRSELGQQDLDPTTKEMYWECVNSYRRWLDGREPDIASAKEFIAYLRELGYKPRSCLLYYHALRLFFESIDQILKVKIRKPNELSLRILRKSST